MTESVSRSGRLDAALQSLLSQAPEIEAAAVVSFDGLPMASALPPAMDEDRVAAMSAALLSLGERAAEGLGRGELSQVYIEGESGTVFLVSADNEAVLVAVAAKGAKVGLMLFEVRKAAVEVAAALRDEVAAEAEQPAPAEPPAAEWSAQPEPSSYAPQAVGEQPTYDAPPAYEPQPSTGYAPLASAGAPEPNGWPSYLPNGTTTPAEPASWS